MNDVLTDLRAQPVKFPENRERTVEGEWSLTDDFPSPKSTSCSGSGIALHGMARAAEFLLRENISVLTKLRSAGYLIR